MKRIFVSYRRQDSGYVADAISKQLVQHFGEDSVFFDIDSIPLGTDFRMLISDAVEQCDVLLAIIGDTWIEAVDEKGQRRLDNPDDFVRLELEAALKRDIPVIPVLVGNANIPSTKDVPRPLRGISFRNATEVRAGRDLQQHLAGLVSGVAKVLQPAQPTKARKITDQTNIINLLTPKIALACLIAALAGFLTLKASVHGFERAVLVWLVFVVSAGLVQEVTERTRLSLVFLAAVPPALSYVISLVIFVLIPFLGITVTQHTGPVLTLGGIGLTPGDLVDQRTLLLALLAIDFFGSMVLIILVTLSGRIIKKGAYALLSWGPKAVEKANKILLVFSAVAGSLIMFWGAFG